MSRHLGDKIIIGEVEYSLDELFLRYTEMLQRLEKNYGRDHRIISDSETPFKRAYNKYKRSLEEGINCFEQYADGKKPSHLFSRKEKREVDEMGKISAINSAMLGFWKLANIEHVDAIVEAFTAELKKRKKSRKRKKTRKRKKPVSKSKKRNKSKRKKR